LIRGDFLEIVILGFALCLILIFVGVPIAMAFGVLTLILLAWSGQDPGYLVEVTYKRIDTILLMSVPLFILFGSLLNATGLASRMVDFVNLLLGKIRSGLGAVTVVTTALFSSIFGSLYSGLITPTEVATLGVVYVFFIGYGYRALNWSLTREAMITTATISGAVILMFYSTETAGRIGNCRAQEYIRPATVLMWAGMLPVLALTTYWPELCLFFPRLAGFIR
jgi:TRAP-type C4-dicarboxylate transport system permease large subunit